MVVFGIETLVRVSIGQTGAFSVKTGFGGVSAAWAAGAAPAVFCFFAGVSSWPTDRPVATISRTSPASNSACFANVFMVILQKTNVGGAASFESFGGIAFLRVVEDQD